MSNGGQGSIDFTTAYWRPRLIKLHQIPAEHFGGGEATPLYLNPEHICGILRGIGKISRGTAEGNIEWCEPVECTLVLTSTSTMTFCVIESPETVAMMRDRELGYQPQPKAV